MKQSLKYAASLIPKNLIESKEYRDYIKFLSSSELWDEKKIAEFQNLELKLLIKQAYENVPYYTEVFNNYGIQIADIKDINDLKKLPLTDKQIVKENQEKFIAKNFDIKSLRKMNTGGTTSSPMHFFNTNTTHNREAAFFNRIWKKYGYEGQLCFILRGYDYDDVKLYNYNPYRKFMVLNTRNFNEDKMIAILDLIKKYKPKFIQAYPSLIYLLSKYINENGLSGKIGSIKTIFCSSEKMYGFQRKEIETAFKTNVIDYYGHNERLVLMEYCNKCDMYHPIPEYGITEFLNDKGEQMYTENGIAEIVGTGFNNYAFPLIRYKTGDRATLANRGFHCACNRPYISVKEIDGRSGDFLVTNDGKYYSPTMLEFAIRHIENFKDLQLVQESVEQLNVLVVPNSRYKEKEGEIFVTELKKRIDAQINISIKIVTEINRPLNQKHRFIISKVK